MGESEKKTEISNLDRPIAFHRTFVKVTGSVPSALFLSQVLYWQRRCPAKRDGWWWKTASDWQEETCLTHAQQKKARKTLVGIGVLEEVKKGIPCRLWFRLNEVELWEVIKCTELRHVEKKEIQVDRDKDGKFASRVDASMPQSRDTISESTPETSAEINPKPAYGGKRLKQTNKEDLEYYQNMFGIEFPASVLNLDAPNRIAAIVIKENLNSEEIRKVFAEFSSSKNKGDVHDPRAFFVSLVKKAKTSELNLSEGGEKCLPPWV